jgi:hypothetical protein
VAEKVEERDIGNQFSSMIDHAMYHGFGIEKHDEPKAHPNEVRVRRVMVSSQD